MDYSHSPFLAMLVGGFAILFGVAIIVILMVFLKQRPAHLVDTYGGEPNADDHDAPESDRSS